jgi:dsDNA-specific endonuclease/ATPase MutS2
VLSALIQNFDTVEKVIETSANSAGSALKENERYLDSIQGKIDQFNNAMQSMWSNLLDSDIVKAFVSWGTKIIQSLDTVQGKFLAIAKVLAIFMAYKKINPFDFIKDISNWMSTIKDGGGLMQ